MSYDIKSISNLYGKEYNGSNKFGDSYGGFGQGHWENAKRWQLIAKDIQAITSAKTVLELGCGRGSLTKTLRDLSIDAVGIDISEWAINNPIDPSITSFIHHQAAQDIDTSKRYDLIVALDVIEHVPYDFYETLFQKFHIVSPCLITTVPIIEGIRRFNSDMVVEHYVAYSYDGWAAEFVSRGYEVVDFEPTSNFPFNKKRTDNYPFYLRVCNG